MRKKARHEVDGDERNVEVLYPSMYFGIEIQRSLPGAPVPSTMSPFCSNSRLSDAGLFAIKVLLCAREGRCLTL